MSSIDKRVCTYINLDGVVMGRGSFMASASPLLYSLLENTMKEVKSPLGSGTVYDMVGGSTWQAKVLHLSFHVEHALLSPYVSPIETPFRHLLLGRGSHTLASIAETTDMEELHTQLALATWNLQGCANAMVGNIWDIDEEI